MYWFADAPRDEPELTVFLTLAISFALGDVIPALWETVIVLLLGG